MAEMIRLHGLLKPRRLDHAAPKFSPSANAGASSSLIDNGGAGYDGRQRRAGAGLRAASERSSTSRTVVVAGDFTRSRREVEVGRIERDLHVSASDISDLFHPLRFGAGPRSSTRRDHLPGGSSHP